jgi:hypothetical protein
MVVLDCGHEPTPGSGSGTGWAEDPDTGMRYCYPCADDRQRQDMLTAARYSAYVREADMTVTTWTGAKLGTITSMRRSPWRYTAHGRYRIRYVRVTDVHGNTWRGSGNDDWEVITLYRMKTRARSTT